MAKHYHSQFEQRQEMRTSDFEIFYYEDKVLSDVSMHRHDYYEIYFFLEGNLSYQIGKKDYPLSPGDLCLIPPGLFHRPKFKNHDAPYRRIVLWLSPDYFKRFEELHPDITYCFSPESWQEQYHFSSDFYSAQLLFNKLLDIIEEGKRVAPFHESMVFCQISSLLLTISRILYGANHKQRGSSKPDPLFSRVCDYINNHLEEDLSLDLLAQIFFVSKYHISHVFKEHMGLPIHQYISKKRLYACRTLILAGEPLKDVAATYGFSDYTSFFRAFKKEFGIGPREYKDTFQLLPQESKEVTDTIEHAVFHPSQKNS